ncbi:unnamed protein product [Blepharisma stoltei]|uniref:Translin-associated factor X-interacting protein 1 N-terminal domain-containing protein n=1 Tax=Blepharisma stoltei TaxID=1481888 RepID=A0AAU9IZH8_9CILI|nr:unnamed protein product [Blepharisma stoltei]
MSINLYARKRSTSPIKNSKTIDSDESTFAVLSSSFSSMNLPYRSYKKQMKSLKSPFGCIDRDIQRPRHIIFPKKSSSLIDSQNSIDNSSDRSSFSGSNSKLIHNNTYQIHIISEKEALSPNPAFKIKEATKVDDTSNRKIAEKFSQLDKNHQNFTVYSEIFNLVIKKDKEFGYILKKIKDVYDAMILKQEHDKNQSIKEEENKHKSLSIEQSMLEEMIRDLEKDKIKLEKELEVKENEIKELVHQCTIIPSIINENQSLKNHMIELEKNFDKSFHFPGIGMNETLNKISHEKSAFTRKPSSKTQYPLLKKKTSCYLKLPDLSLPVKTKQ